MANGSRGSRQAAWEFFGAELKRRREEAGLSQSALGTRVFVSGGYIGQFEQAIRKPQLDVAQRIDETLQTDGFFERMCRKLINDRRYAEYFATVVELERLATEICDFAPSLVPGLLQVSSYTRALTLASHPFAPDEYVEDMVTARTERGRILHDATRPVYWAIMHECVLHIPVGGTATMAAQLDHIAKLGRQRQALVAVIPYSAGAHASMQGSLKLMEFDDAPPTLYTESEFSGSLLDDPALVKHARATYDLLRAAALSPEASLSMIESAAEDYRQCTSPT
ncbi:helix-turn-helix domain-containing protein [Streptomyces sp. NPDC087300]|uniref:helix-turn-helix domain-containing protein n=1 Tax=Streptomyces sp. NPDC087300 TaxID=3365780 RepID=UPI0037F59C9F